MELWYGKPAEKWTEALPLGNGCLGAMVYGGVSREVLCLNLDTLWSGYPRDTNRPGAAASLPEACRLVREGQFLQAQELIEEKMLGDFTQSYLPMCDLELCFDTVGKEDHYRRSLNLDKALAVVSYGMNGVDFRRECFISHPDRCLVLRVNASVSGAVSCSLSFSSQLRIQTWVEGDQLKLEGVAPSHVEPVYIENCQEPVRYEDEPDRKGMRFCVYAALEVQGGSVRKSDAGLRVEGADSFVLRLSANTSFNGFDKQPFTQGINCNARTGAELAAARALPYDMLLGRHDADYRKLYDRVHFTLEAEAPELPTDERLARFARTKQDARLYELLFHYGRYLLIASSREDTQPANLQGIWNRELRPAWSSNYTLNINTQMNYWAVERCNLSELHEPLLQLAEELRVTGAQTARVHYGARGAVAHHNTDIWRLSNPVGKGQPGSAGYAFWGLGYAWLCRHFFEHFCYTQDMEFLRQRAYPAIRDAALFFLDVLTEDRDGLLWFSPATSPENAFIFNGKECRVAFGTTMNIAIVGEVLRNALTCCELLQTDELLAKQIRAAAERLPVYKIGHDGCLLEWDCEYQEAEPSHRHLSHLYPLCPGDEFTTETTPELAEACRKTLWKRGDKGTGWSIGWKACAWARLGDGEHALRQIKGQLKEADSDAVDYNRAGGVYPNLLGAHPPFQIDGNFAALAGIAEMLLQTRGQDILLLPALPEEWAAGSVEGLRTPGPVTVSIWFENGRLSRASFVAEKKCRARVFYRGKVFPAVFRALETVWLTMEDFKFVE